MPDLDRSGSIDITIRYDGHPVSSGELTLHRVGDIKEENGDYSFVLTEEFASSGVTLENPQQPEIAKKLSNYATQQGIAGKTGKISASGSITFDQLKPGLYLLTQSKAATGFEKLNPFLVSLPMRGTNGYTYHVDASPKISPTPSQPENTGQPQTGQSVWPIWLFLLSSAALVLLIRKRKCI